MPMPRVPRVTCTCKHCGKTFLKKPRDIQKGKGLYCSRPCSDNHLRCDLVTRFRQNVGPADANGCTPWMSTRGKRGYGMVCESRPSRRKMLAHRLSYELAYGPIPTDLCVLHKCDNPPCVNPEHLFLGTRADNSADQVSKGRQMKGETHPQHKLTDKVVLECRRLAKLKMNTYAELASMFGVAESVMEKAIRGKTWKHLTPKQ